MLELSNDLKRKCPKGHLIGKNRKTFCDMCWNQTPKGKARTSRYRHTAQGIMKHRLNISRNYYKRRNETNSSMVASYRIVPGNNKETQRRLESNLERRKARDKRYYERWGNLKRNPVHRTRWENIREGLWKEEEHPL